MDQLNKQEIIEMVRFYGSIASTNGVDEGIKRTANKNIDRLVNSLNSEVDRVVLLASGIAL
jgi:hypothetical protein